MNRRHVAAALLAALVLAGFGIAAASLDVVGNEGSGAGAGTGEDSGVGLGAGGGFGAGEVGATPLPDVGPVASLLILLLFLLLAAYGLYTYWRETGIAGLVAMGIGLVLVVAYLLFRSLEGGGRGGGVNRTVGNNSSFGGGGGSVLSGEVTTTTPDPSMFLAVLLAVALLGVGVAYLKLGDDDTLEQGDGETVTTEPDVEAVARAAGDAADRIAAGSADENEVYRAWREMTTHLDVADPATSTPAEFADAAVAAGMARGDVTALTRLFEETRYGDYEPTPAREQRALDALRNIEATYSEEEP